MSKLKNSKKVDYLLKIIIIGAGIVCIGFGIDMIYKNLQVPIGGTCIPRGLILLIVGLILIGVASRRSTPAEHSSTSSKFWHLIALILVVAGISLFSGYWLHKSLFITQSINPQVAPNLEQNLDILAKENIDWAKETITRTDRLVTYLSIIIALLALALVIFGTKWIWEHMQVVKGHGRMEKMFSKFEEEALSMAEELALPLFTIDIIDKDKRKMIEERIEELEGKIRPIEEIDQALTTLHLFLEKLRPKVFIQLGHYYRYRSFALDQTLQEAKQKKGKAQLPTIIKKYLEAEVKKERLKAFDRYRIAADKQKNFAAAYYNMGLMCDWLEKNQEALSFLDKAIEINKNRHELHFQPYLIKGQVLLKIGRYKEAIEVYTIARDLKPDYYRATYNIACGYSKWGDVQKDRKEKEKKWSEALKQLKIVSNIEDVREKAKEDSDFESLRRDEKFGKLFKEFIEQKRK